MNPVGFSLERPHLHRGGDQASNPPVAAIEHPTYVTEELLALLKKIAGTPRRLRSGERSPRQFIQTGAVRLGAN